jgi:hypothetical protein
MLTRFGVLLALAASTTPVALAYNASFSPNVDLLQSQFAQSLADRPKDCPPWCVSPQARSLIGPRVLIGTALTVSCRRSVALSLPSAVAQAESASALLVSPATIVYNRVRYFRQHGRIGNADDGDWIVCGSLAGGIHRPAKDDKPCKCDKGWEGINCNGMCYSAGGTRFLGTMLIGYSV